MKSSSKNTKPKVFLAYNSQDKKSVKAIAEQLRQKGLDAWLDEDNLPAGVSFQDRIQDVIYQVDAALIFISRHGIGPWQQWELRAFLTRLTESDIPVIPVLLPGAKQIPEDQIFLRQLNWVQFNQDLADPNIINKLVRGITRQSSYISYEVLESSLKAGLWREANIETRRIIWQSANRERDRYLNEEEMRNFDGEVLLTLDRLWLQYSQNRFGFSVQKRLLAECQKDATAFGTKVGWRLADGWINEAQVTYSLNAPIGHLPFGMLALVSDALSNAALDGFMDGFWAINKALVKESWQRQLMADSVGVMEFLMGNRNYSAKEFKEGLDFQFAHDEGWWQGERAAHKRIEHLCLMLFSCAELEPVDINGKSPRNENPSTSQQPNE